MKYCMVGLFDTRVSNACRIHFCEVADALANAENQVTVIIPRTINCIFKNNNIINKALFFYYNDSVLNLFFYSIYQLLMVFIMKPKCDIFYLRWRFVPIFFFKMAYIFNKKKPIFVTEHNGWVEYETKIQYNCYIVSLFSRYIQVFDALFADKIIVVTEGIKEKLRKYIKSDRIYVIDNGTNIHHFFPLKNRDDLKRKLLNTDSIVLGYIGSISKWQGIEILIDVFKSLSMNKDIFLLIIGEGLYFDKIKNIITDLSNQNNVFLTGNINYELMNEWINVIDIAFSPKSIDLDEIGYAPLKIRDYAAAGKLIIASKVNGIKELEQYGWIKTFTDKNELYENVLFYINNPCLIKIAEVKARQHAEAFYDWNQIVKALSKAIES